MLIKHVVHAWVFFVAVTALAQQQLNLNQPVPKRPYGGSVSLGTSLGIGSFVPDNRRAPSLSSSLSLNANHRFAGVGVVPDLTLSANTMLNSWWLSSWFTSIQAANNRFLWNDVSVTLAAPNWIRFDDWGLSISPSLSVTGPLSKSSQALRRIIGLGVGTSVAFNRSNFSVSWAPSFTGWVHSGSMLTMSCADFGAAPGLSSVFNSQDSNASIDSYIQGTIAARDEEKNGDTCFVSGRQTVGMLSNALNFSWSPGRHSISANLGWYINFLRPLAYRPEVMSINATGQNFTELTMGRLAYTYNIPVDFNLSVSAGVMSYQSAYDKRGNLTFPFFDFVTPGKNQTQLFVQLTTGI